MLFVIATYSQISANSKDLGMPTCMYMHVHLLQKHIESGSKNAKKKEALSSSRCIIHANQVAADIYHVIVYRFHVCKLAVN